MFTPYSQPLNKEYNEDDELENDEIYMELTENPKKFYQIAYYQGYFNVTTMDVL